MKVFIEPHPPGLVGDFLDALAASAGELGHEVGRRLPGPRTARDAVTVVWNGRRHRAAGTTLYCEHAWLPRWEYQVSPGGINADSHIAPFVWDGTALTDAEDAALERHLAAIREGSPTRYPYMQTAAPAMSDLPADFLLVPLQMEWDTNIQRHVPRRLRQMQALVDHVSRAAPPFPILFKQHPADVRRGDRQLRLVLRRRQDLVYPHARGNIHQLLKSGGCRGIVALNSNVVHDGLIWDVPAVVLGDNVWPRHGVGPFLTELPADWRELERQLAEPEKAACRRAYAHYLMKNQWSLDDARDPAKVDELFKVPGKVSGAPAVARRPAAGCRINVAALDKGWFFEDLKRHFLAARRPGVEVVASAAPRPDADAWIVIRTHEAGASPDPARTLVQVHDLYDHGLYRAGGQRSCVVRCAAVALTHPDQRRILERSGVDLAGKALLERPIGALAAFTPRTSLPPRFTVAWVGRPVRHRGEELKRVDWFVEAMRKLGGDVEAVLLGERLEAQVRELARARIRCRYLHRSHNPIGTYPAHYRGFDCVVISSRSEAGPLCLFEALASGVPVVSTPVGWSPRLLRDGGNGFLIDSVDEMVRALRGIRDRRQDWFERRESIGASVAGLTLESWVDANLDLASRLASAAATSAP